MSTSPQTDHVSVDRILGFNGSIDDLSAITLGADAEHDNFIKRDFWKAFWVAVKADDRIVEAEIADDGRFWATGLDVYDLDDAVDEAAAAGFLAAEAYMEDGDRARRCRQAAS